MNCRKAYGQKSCRMTFLTICLIVLKKAKLSNSFFGNDLVLDENWGPNSSQIFFDNLAFFKLLLTICLSIIRLLTI